MEARFRVLLSEPVPKLCKKNNRLIEKPISVQSGSLEWNRFLYLYYRTRLPILSTLSRSMISNFETVIFSNWRSFTRSTICLAAVSPASL